MKKIITLSLLSILYITSVSAQRGGFDNDRNDDVYGQNSGYGYQGQRGNNNQGYGNQGYGQNSNNPYNDPNYYPNNGRNCGTPPPPPCYNRPRPIVVVPPSFCSPVVIAPNPYYGYRPYNNYGHRRHHRNYSYGHGRRW